MMKFATINNLKLSKKYNKIPEEKLIQKKLIIKK